MIRKGEFQFKKLKLILPTPKYENFLVDLERRKMNIVPYEMRKKPYFIDVPEQSYLNLYNILANLVLENEHKLFPMFTTDEAENALNKYTKRFFKVGELKDKFDKYCEEKDHSLEEFQTHIRPHKIVEAINEIFQNNLKTAEEIIISPKKGTFLIRALVFSNSEYEEEEKKLYTPTQMNDEIFEVLSKKTNIDDRIITLLKGKLEPIGESNSDEEKLKEVLHKSEPAKLKKTEEPKVITFTPPQIVDEKTDEKHKFIEMEKNKIDSRIEQCKEDPSRLSAAITAENEIKYGLRVDQHKSSRNHEGKLEHDYLPVIILICAIPVIGVLAYDVEFYSAWSGSSIFNINKALILLLVQLSGYIILAYFTWRYVSERGAFGVISAAICAIILEGSGIYLNNGGLYILSITSPFIFMIVIGIDKFN